MKTAALVIYIIVAALASGALAVYWRKERKRIRRFQDRCTAKTEGTFVEYRYAGMGKKKKLVGARFAYRAPDGEIAKPIFPVRSEAFKKGDKMEFWYDPENYYFVCTDSMIKGMKRELREVIIMTIAWLAAGLAVVLNFVLSPIY